MVWMRYESILKARHFTTRSIESLSQGHVIDVLVKLRDGALLPAHLFVACASLVLQSQMSGQISSRVSRAARVCEWVEVLDTRSVPLLFALVHGIGLAQGKLPLTKNRGRKYV